MVCRWKAQRGSQVIMQRRKALRTGLGAVLAATSGVRLWAARVSQKPATRFHRTRRHVATPQGRIAYWERGFGPAALFLHGWPLNGYHWRDAMAGLASARRCIAPDFMGLGHTEVPIDADLSPSAQCAMIIAFMDALHIASADLISNDSGNTVAQLMVARHPDRVSSLLITNGDVHTNSPPDLLKPAIAAARGGRLVEAFDRHLSEPAFGQSPEGLGGLAYTNASFFDRELAEIYLRPLVGSRRRRRQCQQYGIAFEPNPLPAIESALRQSAVPTRIVWGTGDALFPLVWARWLDDALPGSRGIRRVENANLFFPEEFPKLVIEEARGLWGI